MEQAKINLGFCELTDFVYSQLAVILRAAEKLDYVPASFKVKRYVRGKYACKQCQDNVSIGPLPPMAIDKGIPAEGLLAHIITSKYADHLPLNRLEGIIKRSGVDINVSTMCVTGWAIVPIC